jgi:hypothetical protein
MADTNLLSLSDPYKYSMHGVPYQLRAADLFLLVLHLDDDALEVPPFGPLHIQTTPVQPV